jgi:hypothetical protein
VTYIIGVFGMKLKMFVINSFQLCYLHRIAPLIKQPKEMERNRMGLTVAHTWNLFAVVWYSKSKPNSRHHLVYSTSALQEGANHLTWY